MVLYQLSHKGSPRILEWVAIPFPADLHDPGIRPGSPALQADSLPTELLGKPSSVAWSYPILWDTMDFGMPDHPILHCFLAAATAAKSLQLCPTLCDPIDGSPPVSPIAGILQARTLEWLAIPFSVTVSLSFLKLMSIESMMPSSFVAHFSSLQSFPASGSFPISWLFASCGQSIGASA